MKPTIAVVGGFLGAGKTTLILAAARLLQQRGLRPAAILNDQGGDLVDTHYASALGVDCDQVTGGCFCCRFPDLVEAAGRLLAFRPDVIFAEAVGSCTDIVATTLRPLIREHRDRFEIAPLTVVLHPQANFDDGNLDFLYRNQIAEADILYARGESVQQWVDKVLTGEVPAGTKTLEIDYARYAEAEAALAWLNLRVTARARPAISAPMLIGPLLDRLEPRIRIVHLKLFMQSDAGYLKAALTGNGREPVVEGALAQSPSGEHEILLNVRALADPAALRAIVEREFSALPAQLEWRHVECFRPSPPVPYHRE
ncbi:MAG TPA: GTP-binding protein [Bryobacteraceae bacterium]|nr:GTP-binding protein [Bryobacteraceae bacterium]